MDKPSIFFLSGSYYPMQGTNSLYSYSRELSSLEYNVSVIACKRENEPLFDIVDKVKIIRIPINAPLGMNILGKVRFIYNSIQKLNKFINIEKQNIVHIYGFYVSIPILLITKAIKPSARIKWFYDIRSTSIHQNKFLRYAFNTYIKLETRFYDGIFIIDEMLKFLVINKNLYISPLGVDFKLFHKKRDRSAFLKYGIKDDDIVLVYIGNLSPNRKIENLLKAFYLASKKADDLWLLIIGGSSSLTKLSDYSIKLGISTRVLFLGHIKYTNVPDYLSNADIGMSYVPIVPHYNIQPPLKTIEYLACSLPVIATKTKGNERYVKNEINGILTKDNPNAVSDAIIKLSKDTELRNSLSNNARFSVNEHDIKNTTKKYLLPAYQKVLNNKKNNAFS